MRSLLLAAALLAAAPACADGFSEPIAADSRPLRFETPKGGPLAFHGAVAVSPPDKLFGGLSGLVMEGPDAALAISDIGRWIRFRLKKENGRLTGVEDIRYAPILDAEGKIAPPGARNAEALARDPVSGRIWVAFEGYHRIWVYDAPDGPVLRRVLHPDWASFSENAGIEALARDAEGRLWAVGEDEATESFPLWIGGPGAWEAKRVPRRGDYRPTGADFDPQGRFYLTTRAFSYTGGFRFQLRRLTWGPGETPVTDEVLLEYGAVTNIDNIESVAIWADAGRTWLLIAADDNFMPLERNVLALYEITD